MSATELETTINEYQKEIQLINNAIITKKFKEHVLKNHNAYVKLMKLDEEKIKFNSAYFDSYTDNFSVTLGAHTIEIHNTHGDDMTIYINGLLIYLFDGGSYSKYEHVIMNDVLYPTQPSLSRAGYKDVILENERKIIEKFIFDLHCNINAWYDNSELINTDTEETLKNMHLLKETKHTSWGFY